MKYTLEVSEQEEAFVLELLRRITSVKLTPVRSRVAKPAGMDETDYLLSNPVNARELRESIAQIRRGQTVQRELLD